MSRHCYFSEFNSLLLTKKSKKLTLILFYSEFSLAFLKAQSVFKKVIEDLTPIGKLTVQYVISNVNISYLNKTHVT